MICHIKRIMRFGGNAKNMLRIKCVSKKLLSPSPKLSKPSEILNLSITVAVNRIVNRFLFDHNEREYTNTKIFSSYDFELNVKI